MDERQEVYLYRSAHSEKSLIHNLRGEFKKKDLKRMRVIMSERYLEFCRFPPFLSKRKIDVKICLGICNFVPNPRLSYYTSSRLPYARILWGSFGMTFILCFHDIQLDFKI